MQDWLFGLSKNRIARLLSPKLRKAFLFDQHWLSPALKVQHSINSLSASSTSQPGPYIYPSFRLDGVGIQVLIRIACKALAKQKGAQYVHIPFVRIEHREIDPIGQSMTDLEWAQTWENYFNFGKGETLLQDTVDIRGRGHLAGIFTDQLHRFGDPNNEHDVQNGLAALTQNPEGHYVFNLGLCKHFSENNLKLPDELLKELRYHLDSKTPGGEQLPYHQKGHHIAIHIRRGDVWDQVKKGSKASRFTNKLVGEAYYIDLLRKWSAAYKEHEERPLHFHVFSDGVPDNFPGFHFIDNGSAEIPAGAGCEKVENIHMYLRTSTPFTMHALIHAPVLMPGKSSFGAVAAILSRGKLVHDPEIFEFYPYHMLLTNPSVHQRLVSTDELIPQLLQHG